MANRNLVDSKIKQNEEYKYSGFTSFVPSWLLPAEYVYLPAMM